MSTDFINGILIGTGTTAFGFVLTMLWDLWKMWKEKKDCQDNLLNLLTDELEDNCLTIRNDRVLVDQELGYLKQDQCIVKALNLPRTDFWEVFKQNYDYKLFSIKRVKLIKDLYSTVRTIIVNLESRENYRISNGAMSNFSGRMAKYDEILKGLFNEFEKLYSDFESNKK